VQQLFSPGDRGKRDLRMMLTEINDRFAPRILDIARLGTVHRDSAKNVSLAKEQIAELGAADADRVLQHGLEHRLQVPRRAGDDLQHLGRCCLLLQRLSKVIARFAKLAGARFERLLQSASMRLELLDQFRLGTTRRDNARSRLRSG
jgi:hypothetical protein